MGTRHLLPLALVVVCNTLLISPRLGRAAWIAAGVPISPQSGNQLPPVAVSDGAGGAIIVWEDGTFPNDNLRAQHIDAQGNLLWAINGLGICTLPSDEKWPVIVSDGSGGAIIAWVDY